MKRIGTFIAVLCLVVGLSAFGGCSTTPPAPVNANGTKNISVAVDEAVYTYGLAMHTANKYLARCKLAPTTVGCNTALITQIESASDKAWTSLTAAQQAVATLPPGAAGIDAALADANAALLFLQSLTAQAK